MTMTDQNQNTTGWNDPNRRDGAAGAVDAAGGNQSGGQQPSGQPGVYADQPDAAPEGQYGQPGEYAAPSAHASEGHYGQPGEYANPDRSAPGQYTDQFGQPGQYGDQSPYSQQGQQDPGQYGQQGQYGQPGQYGQQGQHGQRGQYGQQAPGSYGPGQNGGSQNGPGAYGQYPQTGGWAGASNSTDQFAPFGHQPQPGASAGEHVGPSAPAPTRRPRADENGEPYGVGPFTLREVVLAGLGVVLLIASFLPLIGGEYLAYVGYSNLWGPAPWLVVPGALIFIAAAALLVLRRTVPRIRWRVGSLSVDQFASAAAISTAGFHLGAILLMSSVGVWLGGTADGFAPGAGPILGLIVSLAAIALTTFANRIPPFSSDVDGRAESVAHPLARDPKAVPQRPKPEPQLQQQAWQDSADQHAATAPGGAAGAWPAPGHDGGAGVEHTAPGGGWTHDAAEPWPGTPAAAQSASAEPTTAGESSPVADEPRTDPRAVFADEGAAETTAYEPIDESTIVRGRVDDDDRRSEEPVAGESLVAFGDTANDATRTDGSATGDAPAQEEPVAAAAPFAPYWVLAPEPRTVADLHSGAPLFQVGPTAWALAVGEHEGGLVIRADDGRVGVLRSTDDLTRG
jgi:hypothetical protein